MSVHSCNINGFSVLFVEKNREDEDFRRLCRQLPQTNCYSIAELTGHVRRETVLAFFTTSECFANIILEHVIEGVVCLQFFCVFRRDMEKLLRLGVDWKKEGF